MSELSKITLDKAMVRSYLWPENSFFIAQMVAKSPQFLGNKNLKAGYLAGFGFAFDQKIARIKAMGEFLERYFAERGERKLRRFSIKEAKVKKMVFLNPNEIRPYHDCPKIEAKFPQVSEDEPISYVLGEDQDGNEIWLPARAVFLPFVPNLPEPAFMSCSATGTAAHTDKNEAKKSAVLEVLERHALMASFRLKDPVKRFADKDVPPKLMDFLAGNNLKLRLFDVGKLIPTAMAMITDSKDEKLSIGSKAGAMSIDLIKGAIAEALATRKSLEKSSLLLVPPRSSFEHMAQGFHHPKAIIDFYEQKSHQKPFMLDSEMTLEEVLSKASGPVFFAHLGQHDDWQVVRALMSQAYSKEGDNRYPHLKRFLCEYDVKDLHLDPHPFG